MENYLKFNFLNLEEQESMHLIRLLLFNPNEIIVIDYILEFRFLPTFN